MIMIDDELITSIVTTKVKIVTDFQETSSTALDGNMNVEIITKPTSCIFQGLEYAEKYKLLRNQDMLIYIYSRPVVNSDNYWRQVHNNHDTA